MKAIRRLEVSASQLKSTEQSIPLDRRKSWLPMNFAFGGNQKEKPLGGERMKTEMTYRDTLVSITEDEIIFEHYHFPTGKKKKIVRLADIECITVEQPTIWNGKWRIHGTGNFKTWYPKDNKRPTRDRIFFTKLKSRWINIGFTVEHPDQVERIFKGKKLMRAV